MAEDPSSTPSDDDSHMDPFAQDEDDDNLWLPDIARQVEADAKPLFAAAWLWLLQQALKLDENEPAG